MKQNKISAAAFDLNDLERELQKAVSPRKASGSDDPLAELARIVDQDQTLTKRATGADAFSDFLTAAPRASDFADPAPPQPHGLYELPAMAAPAPIAAPAQKPVDPLEALLAQDLGLRSGLDELPEIKPPTAPTGQRETLASLEALIAGEAEASVSSQEGGKSQSNAAAAEPPDAPAAPVSDPADPVVGQMAIPSAISASPVVTSPPAGQFDDMLAEFEAAMRDVAPVRNDRSRSDETAIPIAASAPLPPAGDIVVPAAMHGEAGARQDEIVQPTAPGIETAAYGAAAGAAIAAGSMASARQPRQRRGLMLAGGAIAVAVIGLGALAMFGGGASNRQVASGQGAGNVPVIAAKPGATKERPVNPGGVEVPNQDKEILQSRTAQTPQQERVAPREEQPVDLTQAQRQAAAAAAAPASASSPPVRQIPGVALVAPVTTTPPPGATPAQPAEAQPRPVASVPITIAGQPPQAAVAPLPSVVAPPAVTAPQPAAPAPLAATPVAPRPTPSATAPASAQTAQPGAAATTAAAAATEPRRVRSVPIRPDNGEATPNRAQTQPRVVPAAPPVQAAAPTLENAPLRISPQANRGPAPQPQASAPSQVAVGSGTVPSSRPTLDGDAPAASPVQTASAGGGSGFSVQLAAEGSEEAARAKLNRVRSQYGSIIGGASPNIRSAEVNGRSVYRVRVGGMSREEAVGMCERLKASGGSCFVARN
jgi:hypothetical protein